MKYEGMIIRPPSEADSLLLQVTVGCSNNRCTFCPTYKEKKFRIKSDEEILEDIREAGRYRQVPRVFLCDGDALIIPQPRLIAIMNAIGTNHHGIERIGTYANAKSILKKSPEELLELRKLGLKIVYMGVETGNEELLKAIHKNATYKQLVEAGTACERGGHRSFRHGPSRHRRPFDKAFSTPSIRPGF